MTPDYDIEIDQGTDTERIFNCVDGYGNAMDFSGYTARMQIRRSTYKTAPLNELKTGIDAAVKIDDAKTQAGTTWSSTKINSAINAAISALVSGAPEALDTIKEVADAINTNKNAITALQQIAAGHVKFDAAQTLSDTQKQQARENIDAVSAAQLAATDTKAQKGVDDAAAAKAQADKGVRDAATAKTAAEKANGDLTTFKTNIGDTTVDFAAVYTAARDAN